MVAFDASEEMGAQPLELIAADAGERRIARKQLRQLRDELRIRDEFDRIETEQRYFAMVDAYAATIESDGFALPF